MVDGVGLREDWVGEREGEGEGRLAKSFSFSCLMKPFSRNFEERNAELGVPNSILLFLKVDERDKEREGKDRENEGKGKTRPFHEQKRTSFKYSDPKSRFIY